MAKRNTECDLMIFESAIAQKCSKLSYPVNL